MNMNRRSFLGGVSLATFAGAAAPARLLAEGTTLVTPGMATGLQKPGKLVEVVHDVDVCVVGGAWKTVFETKDNHQRLVRGKICRECLGVRLVPLSTWGSELKENDYGSSTAHIFAFEPV